MTHFVSSGMENPNSVNQSLQQMGRFYSPESTVSFFVLFMSQSHK